MIERAYVTGLPVCALEVPVNGLLQGASPGLIRGNRAALPQLYATLLNALAAAAGNGA